MSVAAAPGFARSALLPLGRISNLPTVWTNVIAGAVIAGGARRAGDIVLIALAMSAFYVGGMYLNDFFDRAIDARERPTRPIVAGEIAAGTVAAIGFGLLGLGIVLMIPFGLAAMLWGIALVAAIVLYDVWHKGNALGPTIMGLCRALVYFGAGAAIMGQASGHVSLALAIGAAVLAAHTAGITYAARQENLDTIGSFWPLALLTAPLIAALPAIASGWTVPLAVALLLAADAAAVWLLARRKMPGAVPRAVSGLIAAISLVDAVAVSWAGGDPRLVLACALGYPLTRLFQASIPGT
jgi:4-hydroxybenzoate polyprenyltransferase